MVQLTEIADAKEPEIDRRKAFLEELRSTATTAAASPQDGAAQGSFQDFVQRSSTINLIPAISLLLKPGQVSEQVREKLLGILYTLPLRPRGVRDTLEFVFSTHPANRPPSDNATEAAKLGKKGASITPEALSMATNLLAHPPAVVKPEEWFGTIAPQLLGFLDGKDGDELIKVAAYVIGFGILGQKKYGSPTTPGWTAFAEPLLRPINFTLMNTKPAHVDVSSEHHVVDLTRSKELVASGSLRTALWRLRALLTSHPNAPLVRRLVSTVLVQLWILASWPRPSPQAAHDVCTPARILLEMYLKLSPPEKLRSFANHLLDEGGGSGGLHWKFTMSDAGGIHVLTQAAESRGLPNLLSLDAKASVYVKLVQDVASADTVTSLFLDLFKAAFATKQDEHGITLADPTRSQMTDPVDELVNARILQEMMEKIPEQLSSQPTALLDVASQILSSSQSADGQAVGVALSLLNLVISAPGFAKSKISKSLITSMEGSLDRLSEIDGSETATTARNLSMLLRYRDELPDASSASTPLTDKQVEDRKQYNLALSYITQTDSPPPVRAEGLSILQRLITAHSPILDLPATLVLMFALLKEDDDYLNLRVIKMFTQLADRHPKTVIDDLLEHFIDKNESSTVDVRLRVSEALSLVIERLGEKFTGEIATRIGEALLSTAGRRAHRSRTERRQAHEARTAEMRRRKQDEEMDGVELPDPDEDLPDDEKMKKEILAQIVGGWESKRGSEDLRVRASALSTFAVGIDTNVGGLKPVLVSTSVDLSLNILTAETAPEAGILRRAAVMLDFTFVKALDQAREAGRQLGFGLTTESQADIRRTLEYVAATDNDGLVKQQAADTIEALDALKINDLASMTARRASAQASMNSGLTKLAGLGINPGSSQVHGRPKIEEVE